MKPATVVAVLLSLLGLGCVLLVWFGVSFVSYLQTGQALVVSNLEARQLPLHAGIDVELQGSGFDRDTRVGLIMDIGNHDMVVNHYPLDGYFNTSLIQERYLFLGSNDGLHVLSLAEPASPRLLDTYLAGRSIVDLHFAGGYLFVSCGRLGLVVMTQENDKLSVVAEIWTGDTVIQSRLHRGYLYVGTVTAGIMVYDLKDPAGIERISHLQPEQPFRMMAFYRDLLYLMGRDNRLYLFDCSTPHDVTTLGRLDFPEQIKTVLVHQEKLYVALATRVLLHDLAEPRRPQEIQSWDGFGLISRIIAGRDRLYLVDRNTGLRMLDLKDLSISDQMEFSAGLQTLAEGEQYLYVTGSLNGLLTVDRQELRSRQMLKWISPVMNVHDVVAEDDVYFLATSAGLVLVNPENDDVLTVASAGLRSSALTLFKDLLFVGQAQQGIKVFDVAKRRSPELVAEWPELFANRLVMVGHYLVTASQFAGLRSIDVADIARPRVVDSHDVPHVLGMALEGNHLFCVTHGNGMLVYRIHEQGTLESIAHFSPPFPINKFDEQVDIDVHDGTAYIANGRSGLMVVDVRNPERPQLLTTVGLPGYSKGVRVHNNLVYVVTLRHGIHLVDSGVPHRAVNVGNLPISRLSKFLLVRDGLLYFFQDSNGMAAVPLPLFAASVKTGFAGRLTAHLPAPEYPGRYNLQISNRNGMVTRYAAVEYDRAFRD